MLCIAPILHCKIQTTAQIIFRNCEKYRDSNRHLLRDESLEWPHNSFSQAPQRVHRQRLNHSCPVAFAYAVFVQPQIVELGGTSKASGRSSDTTHTRQKKSATSTNAFAAMDGVSLLNDQCQSLVCQVLNNGLCRSTRKPIKA